MKMRFLCAMHRLQIADKPSRAIHCWQDGFDTGQNLYDQKLWSDALPYLGCAFEVSEIIMTMKVLELGCYCELFVSSSVLLANTFTHLDCTEQSREVYELAICRLEQELAFNSGNAVHISQCLSQMYRGMGETFVSAPSKLPLTNVVVH